LEAIILERLYHYKSHYVQTGVSFYHYAYSLNLGLLKTLVCITIIFNAIPLQYNCNSGGWNNIQNLKVCGFTPNTLVNCEIRARRDSNSINNQDSEVTTSSVTTPCPAGIHYKLYMIFR